MSIECVSVLTSEAVSSHHDVNTKEESPRDISDEPASIEEPAALEGQDGGGSGNEFHSCSFES